MTLFNIKLATWCFLFGAVILCGYTTTQSIDYAPIIGSWLLMTGAFFGFCDEAQVFPRQQNGVGEEELFGTQFRKTLPHFDDYQAHQRVGLPLSDEAVVTQSGDCGE